MVITVQEGEQRVSRLEGASDHFATKADTQALRADIESLRADMYRAMGDLRDDIKSWTIRLIISSVIATSALVTFLQYLMQN